MLVLIRQNTDEKSTTHTQPNPNGTRQCLYYSQICAAFLSRSIQRNPGKSWRDVQVLRVIGIPPYPPAPLVNSSLGRTDNGYSRVGICRQIWIHILSDLRAILTLDGFFIGL